MGYAIACIGLKSILIGQSFRRKLVFKNKFFKKLGFVCHLFMICYNLCSYLRFVHNLFMKRLQLKLFQEKTSLLSYFVILLIVCQIFPTNKVLLNCHKFENVFEIQRKLSNFFRFKDQLPLELMHRALYMYISISISISV